MSLGRGKGAREGRTGSGGTGVLGEIDTSKTHIPSLSYPGFRSIADCSLTGPLTTRVW